MHNSSNKSEFYYEWLNDGKNKLKVELINHCNKDCQPKGMSSKIKIKLEKQQKTIFSYSDSTDGQMLLIKFNIQNVFIEDINNDNIDDIILHFEYAGNEDNERYVKMLFYCGEKLMTYDLVLSNNLDSDLYIVELEKLKIEPKILQVLNEFDYFKKLELLVNKL